MILIKSPPFLYTFLITSYMAYIDYFLTQFDKDCFYIFLLVITHSNILYAVGIYGLYGTYTSVIISLVSCRWF